MSEAQGREDRRSGEERRRLLRALLERYGELWRAHADLADRLADRDPAAALDAAAEALASGSELGPERAVLLAASGLEAVIAHLLADRLAPADAAISVFRGEAADAKFIDFTLKDLLSRALEREPVGRRGLKASVWHAAVALLSARNALLRTGGQDLIEALGGAEAAHAAARDWCAAAGEVVAQLRKWA